MANAYLFNLACGLYLMGLIWTIQFVHYPSFAYVDKSAFNAFNSFHQSGMTYIVAPVMILELISVLYMWAQNFSDLKIIVLVVMVGLLWLSTFLVSVPIHTQLLNGFNEELINKLVVTNWPRTILWSAKALIMVYFLRLYVPIR